MPKLDSPYLKKASSDYGYINARVRGMRAGLLTSAHYQELLSVTTLQDVLDTLQNTHFAHHFQMLGETASIETLQEIIRRDLTGTIETLSSLIQGRIRQLFNTLLLYWEMETMRTVLRGKFKNCSKKEILSQILPIGRLTQPLIEVLLDTEGVRSIVQTLYAWRFPLGKSLLSAVDDFEEKQDLLILEHALERSFFIQADEISKSLTVSELSLKNLLTDLMDLFNARAVLRLREEGANLEEALTYFLGKGNHLGKSLFISILQQDSSENACNLIATHFMLGEKPKDELNLERILEERLFKSAIRSFLGDPLGFDILLGFLWLKIAEIRNVRVLVEGKLARIRNERLEEELIYA